MAIVNLSSSQSPVQYVDCSVLKWDLEHFVLRMEQYFSKIFKFSCRISDLVQNEPSV